MEKRVYNERFLLIAIICTTEKKKGMVGMNGRVDENLIKAIRIPPGLFQ